MNSRFARWTVAASPSLVVGLVAMGVYLNTLGHGFVFDDVQNILQNPWIKDPRLLHDIFTRHVAGFDPGLSTSYYRPLMHVLYMLTYQVFGLAPWGFHLVNVLLHAGCSILVLRVSAALWRDLNRSGRGSPLAPGAAPLLAALVFAVHPVHTEAVAWLAGITDLSFVFFFLAAFSLFAAARRPFGPRNLLASAAFFAAALCKEPALILPAVLAAYDVLRRRDKSSPVRATAVRMLPFAAAALLYLGLRLHALGGFAPSTSHRELSLAAGVVNGIALLANYVWKLVWPVELNALYTFRPIGSLWTVVGLFSLATLFAVIAAAVLARRRPLVLLGLLLVALPLLPALYIPALGDGVFAERYLYLPVFGFALLLAQCFAAVRLVDRRAATIAAALPLLLVLGYGVGTIRRNGVWRDSLTLWTDVVRKSPDSAAAREYLGFALYSAGRLDEAIASYRRALALDPARADSHLNLGVAYALLGRRDEAIAEYVKALELRPGSAEAHSSLGLALAESGELARGLAELRTALNLNPALPGAHNNLGVALMRSGAVNEATAQFAEAVRLEPGDLVFRRNLDRARSFSAQSPAPP